MTVKTTDFPPALKSTLHDVFEASWKKRQDQYSRVFDVETSFDAYEDELQIQGPDEIPVATEGSVFERVEIENVRSKRYTHAIYKGEVKITREALDDIKYGKITDAVAKLAIAGFRTVERIGAAFFYNGLIGSELSPDGAAVFGTHNLSNPLPGRPTTDSNAGTGRLGSTNIRAARADGRKTLDEHGSLAPYYLTQLLVGPDLEDEAYVQKGSDQKPGTTNNDDNYTGRQIKDIVVLDFLAEAPNYSDSMWFLRDPDMARNKFFWRVKPERKLIQEEASGDWLYRLYFRCSAGCSDWRGLWASTGTTA